MAMIDSEIDRTLLSNDFYHQVRNYVYHDLDVLNEYLLNFVLDHQITEYVWVLSNQLLLDYL
jgi:hypothetical protein